MTYRLKGETEKAMHYYKEAERLAVSLHDSTFAIVGVFTNNSGFFYPRISLVFLVFSA